jgi:hypothetical protein
MATSLVEMWWQFASGGAGRYAALDGLPTRSFRTAAPDKEIINTPQAGRKGKTPLAQRRGPAQNLADGGDGAVQAAASDQRRLSHPLLSWRGRTWYHLCSGVPAESRADRGPENAMAQIDANLSTGLPGLDRVLKGLIPGDNIVWQVDSVADYRPFIAPYCASAAERGQRLIYLRFAKHEPLVAAESGAEVRHLHPEAGFETFLADLHKVIEQTGRGGFYVFDCLSELTVDWYSDQMLGNFFMLTCPYLYDVEAIAYFGLLKDHHAHHATSAISNTAQVLVDVHRHRDRLYIHPLKVQQRSSPTMYMLHAWEGTEFRPVLESATIAEILTSVPWRRLVSPTAGVGIWDRTFARAGQVLREAEQGQPVGEQAEEYLSRLVRMAISRDERVFHLVRQYMTLADVIEIGKRMIGTGLIGGKSVGMLLARAILRSRDGRWSEQLEPHDSFYIGSDVFYTFLVQNGVWWSRQGCRDPQHFLEGAETARRNVLRGSFPAEIEKQFADMLDYFGQSPIIVRSSSLLEDNFGNAFAGKYESVFCANQGSRDQRLADFMSAVKAIYASTMSEKALRYRAKRGLLDRDEQMALLVQRVSGSLYGSLFYPQIAGVGFSFNPFRWSGEIDPEAGMVRLVFGLGTRAVDRADDDYTRVVALNAPERRPEGSFDEARQYTQRKVDVLDLQANQLLSRRFGDICRESPQLPLELFASRDLSRRRSAAQAAAEPDWVLTFEKLLSQTAFVSRMRAMLKTLAEAYDYPVDVEFTANFFGDGQFKINLVQCRPLQVKGAGVAVEPPEDIPAEDLLLEARGAVIGESRVLSVDRIIYVVPGAYGQLPAADRYAVARLIGRLAHVDRPGERKVIMLLGPGRWGTTTPALGVPAAFTEINTVSVLCEIVAMRDDFVPDVSLGTHYFSDLVESDILYLALFPGREGNHLNRPVLEAAPNRLSELLADATKWSDVVRVIDTDRLPAGGEVTVNANALDQHVVCYRGKKGDGSRF